MRLWTLHPKYLDTKGLIAQWREGLLAKHVLEGKTKGYKNHPQLERFKNYKNPIEAINSFLTYTCEEARRRGYNFDEKKIRLIYLKQEIITSDGQLSYEFNHLLQKLKKRDKDKYNEIKHEKHIEANPLFKIVKGNIESWEKV